MKKFQLSDLISRLGLSGNIYKSKADFYILIGTYTLYCTDRDSQNRLFDTLAYEFGFKKIF